MSWIPRRRRVVSGIVVSFCAGSVLLALIPLGFILFFALRQGLPALGWAFFTQMPRPVGEPGGGMANAIAGTLILVGLASLIAVPIGVVSGIYLSEYRKSLLSTAARFSADVLNGVPSIVIGLFAYSVAVLPFTAFNNRYWSARLDQPISSLTVQVYTYAISPYDDWHRQAWAGATVLIGAVLLCSLLARLATRRLERMHRP